MIKTILNYLAVVALGTALVSLANGFAPNSPSSFSVFSLPQNLGTTINTTASENSAFVAPSGLSLYVASNAAGSLGSTDLWVSQRPSLTSAWGSLQNLGPIINTVDNENLPSLSADGKTLFFSSSRSGGFGQTDIYVSTRTDPNNDFGWSAPINLGTDINTSDNELGPAYFENQTNGTAVLYFTSTRGGGGEDFYQSTRNANGTFNVPTSISTLNSPMLDRGINIRRDGLEVLIASERDGGAGGRDIWLSTRASVSAPWNPPVNLGVINSSGSEQMPSLSADGSTLYLISSRDGGLDIYAANRVSVNRSPIADFDGDGRTDISVFRPSDGTWYRLNSSNNTFQAAQFGLNGDRIVPGDYDGDGRMDLAVFRPSDQNWYVLRSSDGSFSTFKWGLSTDKPVPGDYDGDGRTDLAVYRNGSWYILQSSNGSLSIQQFGLSTDLPISAGVQ